MQNKKKLEIIVLLHNIRSVHNVASIFRTADGAGVKKIYLCGITPGPLDRFGKILPQFAKVSLGAEKYVKWEKRPSFAKASAGKQVAGKVIDELKNDGYKIFAIEQSEKSIPYYKIRGIRMHSQFRIALILGNEVRGLPPSILKKSDKILEIPMLGKKESLNVSVAFGIVAYGLVFGRRGV